MTIGKCIVREPHGWLRNAGGAVLVEFAFAQPILLILYGGAVQLSDAISCDRKVTVTTRTVADLVAQNTTGSTSAAEVDATLAASTQVMAPYNMTNALVRITEVTTDLKGNTTVVWSQSLNGLPLVKNAPIVIPANLRVPGLYLILSQAQYSYQPVASFGFINPRLMSEVLYMVPRNTNSIRCSDC